MEYYSLNKKSKNVSFEDAVIKGLAPDRGLYFPSEITPLNSSFFESIETMSNHDIAYHVIEQFVGNEIPKDDLKAIIKDVLNFDFPVVNVEDNIHALELYHGPTMAFKDVGARFMARCLAHFNKQKQNPVTVLVATSGDTGGAVASGFLGVKGVDVVILYPSGKVSDIQEKQLTTLGQNIKALEVNGTFDDCQDMVKEAFLDQDYKGVRALTSANSINIARWLPQMFYFFFTYKQLKKHNKSLVFSVPSGNYGNICAGIMAQKLGLPIQHFIAGTNKNNTVPNYLNTGEYVINKTVATISNAMDVSNPSNFIRIEALYNNNFELLKENLTGFSYTDEETIETLHELNQKGYIADPHGAIGYAALKAYLSKQNNTAQGVFLETAHPIKFLDVMPKDISKNIEMPQQIAVLMDRKKESLKINNYAGLKTFLLK